MMGTHNNADSESSSTRSGGSIYYFNEAGIHIEFDDFIPTEIVSDKVYTLLDEFSSFCPEKSKVKASLRWTDGVCHAVVSVTHNLINFEGKAARMNPFDSLTEGLLDIKEKIRNWRKSRFGEIAAFSHDLKMAKNGTLLTMGEPLKVLFVDDDPISIKLLESCFRQQGCETTVAESGMDALYSLEKNNFDLVVLDWLMPGLTGNEVIKHGEYYVQGDTNIPVITYSINGNNEIKFPNSKHFTRVGHIKKTTPFKRLKVKTGNIISRLRKDKNSEKAIHA